MQSKTHTSVTKLEIKELTHYHPSLTEDINILTNQLQNALILLFLNSTLRSNQNYLNYMTLLKELDNALLPHLKNIISFDNKEL